MNVMPITPHIGAEIRGLDLSISLDNEAFAGVHQAFLDWGVLVFREQELSRDQHKSFARRFGNLHTHPMNNKGTGDPEEC
jgi:taurine dioxygenase